MAIPILAVSPFLALGMLACPIGMGAMMWFMARGTRSPSSPPAQQPVTLDDLRRQHERLGTQIGDLEGPHSDADGTARVGPAGTTSTLVGMTAAGARGTLD